MLRLLENAHIQSLQQLGKFDSADEAFERKGEAKGFEKILIAVKSISNYSGDTHDGPRGEPDRYDVAAGY